MINGTKRTSSNDICQPVYISTRGFRCFSYSLRRL